MRYYRIVNGIAVSCQEDISGFGGTWAEEQDGYSFGDLYDETNGWSHPLKTQEELDIEGRKWRDEELKSTDFIVPLTDFPNYAAWMTYRQELRDWTTTSDFPDTKPTAPAELN